MTARVIDRYFMKDSSPFPTPIPQAPLLPILSSLLFSSSLFSSPFFSYPLLSSHPLSSLLSSPLSSPLLSSPPLSSPLLPFLVLSSSLFSSPFFSSSTLLSSLFSFLLLSSPPLPSLLFYSSRVPLHFNCQWPLLPSALHLSLTDNKVPEVIISCGGWNNFAKVRSFSDATLSDAHAKVLCIEEILSLN